MEELSSKGCYKDTEKPELQQGLISRSFNDNVSMVGVTQLQVRWKYDHEQ
jgi:hypothetical protein